MRRIIAIAIVGLIVIVGVAGYLWLNVFGRFDATIYASGFSEARFSRISRGMSKADVRRILGEPLRNDQEGHVQGLAISDSRWVYAFLDRARIPNDDRVTNTWFQLREVHFDNSGRVDKIVRSAEQFE